MAWGFDFDAMVSPLNMGLVREVTLLPSLQVKGAIPIDSPTIGSAAGEAACPCAGYVFGALGSLLFAVGICRQ